VPIGSIGELYIGGASLARGYARRSGLTSERFIANPFGSFGSRMYRTGDLARWYADGTLEYVGRSDHQVKIRGFRIELGEIESALSRIVGVEQVSVQAREVAGEKQLVAYLVERKACTSATISPVVLSTFSDSTLALEVERPTSLLDEALPQNEIDNSRVSKTLISGTSLLLSVSVMQEKLSQILPDYMVPSNFIVLDQLPLTSNGKLDVRALPDPEIAGGQAYRVPVTAQEQLIADLYAELTGAARVGLDDSFFALGGHSLLAMRLVARIRETFDVELQLSVLFESPSVQELATRLSDLAKTKRFKIIPGEGAR
jgi:nonribosomal peptide synthetase DhbF